MKCSNHWYRLFESGGTIDISDAKRVDCDREATTSIVDGYDDQLKDVCAKCHDLIDLTNYLHTAEGQAELDRQDAEWLLDE